MKKFNASGITAAGVLVLALGAGTVGGVMTAGGSDPAPRPAEVGLKVADEATAAPSAEPTPEATLEPTPAPVKLADGDPCSTPYGPGIWSAAEQDCWVTPTRVEEEPVAGKTETAKEAADRAAKEADRAEEAAKRAEEVASTAPVPATLTPTPKPIVLDTTYDCPEGSKWRAEGVTNTRVKNPTVEDCGGPA